MKGKIFMGALASLSLFLIASACDIGLGGAVDTEIPTGTISSPGVNAVIRDAFAIKGTWKDDGSVGQVTVALSNTNIKTTRTYNAKVAADGTWICAVDPADSAQPLVDGTYLATVTLYDNGGHTNTVTQSYIIDNTPPVVILSYLKSKDDSATEIKTYGKLFTLSGKAADDNNINRIDVKVYQDEACSTELRTITKQNVPAAIEQDVASFGTEEYSAIYGENSTNSQVRYCKVFAYDDAQRYPADGSAQTDSDKLGNCQTSYFFQTTIEKLGYDKYKTNDLYAMFNGTYSNGSQDSSRAALTSDEISTVKKTLTETAVKVGTFALNPKNNPTFTVIGLNKVLLAGGDEDMGTSDSPNSNYVLKNGDANTGTPLTINIVPGLDNYSIDTSTVFAYFQECDKYGNPISGAAKIEIGKNASSFTTNPVSTASYPGLSTSHFYCIVVEGSDTKGSGIEQAYSNGKQQRFAFYLDSVGAAPTLNVKFESSIDGTNWTNNENSLVYLKKDTQVRLSGTVEVEDGTPKLELMLNKNPEYTNSIDPVTELPDWCTEKSDDNIFSFSKTYSASSFGTESKQHSIIIRASQSGRAIEKSYTVLYDQEAPEVSISDVSPIAANYYDSSNKLNENGNTDGKKYLNGKNVKIKLSITDKYDIVDVTNNLAKIELIDSAGTAKTVAENIDTPTNFTTEAIDTTQFAEGEVKIRVTAYDRAGNMTGKTDGSEDIGGYYIKQATDKPVILPNKNTDFTFTIDSEDKLKSSDGINIFSSGAQLILKLIDDDGLKEVVPYLNGQPDIAQKQTFNSTTNSTYEYTLPSTAGVARLKFVLTDINNNSTTVPASDNIYVKVTGDRPSIEISSEVRKPDTNEAAGYKKLETIYTKGDSGEGANYFANTINIDSVYDKFDVYRAVVDVNAAVPAESSFEKINGDTPITEKTYTDAVRPLESKDYYYYVIATADKLKGSLKKITCKVDKLPPVVTLKALPGKDDTAADSYTFSGTSADTGGSGVEEVWVTIIDVTNPAKTKTVKATDTISWACPVTYSSFGNVFDDEGDKKITVKAIDAAGNESDSVEQTFLYDKAVPQIEEIKVITSEISKTDFVSGYMPSNGYKLSFKAKDSYQLKNFVVKQVFTPKSGSAVQKDYEFYTGTDSEKEIELRIPYNPSNPADSTYEPQEGTYSYQFTVADQKGNEVSSKTFECIVDNSAPKVTINNQNYTGINAIDKTSFQFEGDISEDNGMSGVYYVIVPNGATVPTPPESNVIHDLIWSSAGFTKVSSFGTTSWKTQQSFATIEDPTVTPKVYKEGIGYKLYVYAVDKAGNVGHVDASNTKAELTFDVDMAKPKLTSLAKQSEELTNEKYIYNISDLVNDAGNFIVNGTADDSHGIEKIVINVKETDSSSAGTDYIINADAVSNKQWSKAFVFGSTASGSNKLEDGVYTFTVTAYDLVGKTDEKELSITVDTKQPEILDTTENPIKLDDKMFESSKWYGSKTLLLEVKVSDGEKGSKIRSVKTNTTTNDPDDTNWKTISLVDGTTDTYTGNIQLSNLSSDGKQTFYIIAIDKAGNKSDVKACEVQVDITAPELEYTKYKIGDDFSTETFINGTAPLTVYGTYADTQSGVQALTFTGTVEDVTDTNGKTKYKQPVVKYSAYSQNPENIADDAWKDFDDSSLSGLKSLSWRAVFENGIISETGEIHVIGKNKAGEGLETDKKIFKLNKDTNKPELTKIKITPSLSGYSVYEKTEDTGTVYYLNNNKGTFTFSGLAEDKEKTETKDGKTTKLEEASGVRKVTLSINGLTTQPGEQPTAYFSGIDLRSIQGTETTATITVTDNAGNISTPITLTIKFDTAAPVGVHAMDSAGKDLYFRVGDQDRDDGIITKDSDGNVTSASPVWKSAIDKDVGGKYTYTTYGKAQTLKIRGNFVDKTGTDISSDTGSGLSMIYYKIYPDTAPATSVLDALLTNAAYKNSMDGYFSPIKDSESESEGRRRVFFVAGTTAIKNNLDEEISKTNYITITNKIEKISGEPETKETKKYYTDITSTFKATISGLKENATNYLVLIAEDNVGNANYETVKISETESHSDYLINVDTKAPHKVTVNSISADSINPDNENASVKIKAVIEDNLSGISKAVVKVNGTELGTKLFVDGNYTYVTKITEGTDSYDVEKESDTAGEIRLTTEGTVEEVEYSKTKALCEITLNKNAFNGISSGSSAFVQLTVTDAAGTGNQETFNIGNIIVDKTSPTVEIKEIGKTDVSDSSSSTTVNRIIKISGSASDSESGIKMDGSGSNAAAILYLYYREKTENDTSDPTSVTDLKDWTLLKSTSATKPASWSFSEIDTTDLKDNTDYYITVVTEDKAGNTGYSVPKRISVNQDSDRPVITLSNLYFADKDEDKNYLKSITTLYISVNDDDGVDKVEYSLDNGTNWSTYSNGITGLAEGSNTVYFKITDKGTPAKEFITGKADTTKIVDSNEYQISNQPVITGIRVSKDANGNDVIKTIKTGTVSLSFNVVTKNPEISEVKYSYYNSKTDTWSDFAESLRTVGGIYSKIKVQLKASSAQSIKEIKATYSGDTAVDGALPEYDFTCADNSHNDKDAHVWTSTPITIGTGETLTGGKEIVVTAYDTVPDPMTTKETLKFAVDNTKPKLNVSSPAEGKQLSLAQTVRGTINELSSTLYYAVSRYQNASATPYAIDDVKPNSEESVRKTDDNTTVLATKWTKMEDDFSSGTWYIYFDETNPNNGEDHTAKFSTYLTENYLGITTNEKILKNEFDTITPVYFWIKAVDECGNESYVYRRFDIDPQGERPSVEITYPTDVDEKDSNGVATGNKIPPTLGGTIRLAGSATDNNEPKYIWVQIASDGAFGITDLEILKNNNYNLGKISKNESITDISEVTDETASDYAIMIPLTNGTSTATWSLSINGNKEFNPSGEGKNTIIVTVFATDEDTKDGKKTIHVSKSVSQTIYIDAKNPYVEETSLKLVQYDNNGNSIAQQNYNYGGSNSVKGIWYLTGNLKDADSGLKEITYKGVKVIDERGASYTVSSDPNLWFKPIKENGSDYNPASDSDKEYSGLINYKFSIPLGNNENGKVGTDEAELEIIENTEQRLNATPKFSVTYDNKAPEFITTGSSFVKLNSSVQNSSGFYSFGAIASEKQVNKVDQTGVERIAFYFTRDLEYSLKSLNETTYAKHGAENTNDLFDVMIYHSNKEDNSAEDDTKTGNMIINYKASSSGLTLEDGLYWKSLSGSLASNAFTYTEDTNPNIHPRGLVKINGKIYVISGVTGKTISINGELDDAASVTAMFAICNVIDNSGERNSGSITYEHGYGYGYYPDRASSGNDDGDRITETFNNQGTEWIFDAAINSKNLPDGPVTVHLVAFDRAGNISTYDYSGVVSNNAPRIAGMKIGTDENGNGSVDDSELITTYSGRYEKGYENGDSEKPVTEAEFPVQSAANPATVITVKGKTRVVPEIVGGNGTISYLYNISSYNTTSKSWGSETEIIKTKANLGAGSTDEAVDFTIDLPLEHFIGTTNNTDTKQIPDGINKFIFSFGDSTPGATSTTSISNNAKLTVYMNVALREENKAKNYILPFYWNKDDDNSLFKQSKEQGHIELAKDWILASGYDASKAEMDADPKVSGKIKLEGIAQDDTLLNQIIVKLNNKLGTNGFTANNELVIASYDSGNELIPATWSGTQLESDGSIGSIGFATEIKNATYGDLKKAGIITEYPIVGGVTKKESDEVPYTSQEYGHVVHWILYLDTEQIDGVAVNDVTVTATANDRGSPKWSGTAESGSAVYTSNAAAVTGSGYSGAVTKSETSVTEGALTGSYKMDVVPYITKISTRLDDAYSAVTSVFNRSANGNYPVMRGETGFKLYGFNLKGADTTVKFNGTSVGTVTAGTTSDYVTFTVPAAAKSGAVDITVSSVASLNNSNSATAQYNLEPNGINNDTLNDNRNVYVWGMNDVVDGVKTVRYPSFKIGKDSNQTYAFVYDYDGQRIRYNLNGTDSELDMSYSQWYATACAVDTSGNLYGGAQNGDTGGSGGNRYANYKFYAFADSYTAGNYYDTVYGAYRSGGSSIRLENTVYNNTFYAERVQNPKIVTFGSNTTSIYTVYYDSAKGGIIFRYGTAKKGNRATTFGGGIVDYFDNEDTNTSNASVIDNSANVGEYAAVGVIPNGLDGQTGGTAVVCWNADNKLKFKYNTAPTGNTWSDTIVIDADYAGEYCDLAVDAAGGIHIAYYRAGNKLKYAYLESYTDTTPDICMVDSYLSVGENISIETSSKTISYTEGGKTKTRYVPYISYYSNAIGMAKVAWPVKLGKNGTTENTFVSGVNNDRFTGDWEVQVLPTALTTKLLNYTIGVGEKTNETANSVMLGYGTKNGLQTALLY